jgi:uncharacterized tellurite resistance protein B-like protein
MSVLGLLKKVKVQTLSFEKHPCRELEQEEMIHYLNGLALITNEDGTICEKEQEYLSILINSFGLSEEMLETFIGFAQNPDEKRILDMMQSFMNREIKYNFIIDAMLIASVDGNFDEKEDAIIAEYLEMFKMTKAEEQDLRHLYEMFHTQNGNALYRYFGKQDKYDTFLIKKELFEYLLDYYHIDMAYELKEEEKRVLALELFKPTFQQGSLGKNATEIMTKPVSHAQFCIFLNSVYLAKEIEFNGEGKLVDSQSKDVVMDLDLSEIVFKNNAFRVMSLENEEKRITGMTYVLVRIFAQWLSKYNKEEYQIASFDGAYNISMSAFTKTLKDEFLFNYYQSSYSKVNFYIGKIYNSNMLTVDRDNGSHPIVGNVLSKKVSFRLMKLPKKAE